MITSIRLKNFKNFADETLRVGPFTILIGANASGKSNIRDAFRFLSGIGRGYTLAEILGGKYGVGGQIEWETIRGAMKEIIRFGHSSFLLEIELTELGAQKANLRYSLEIGFDVLKPENFRLIQEELKFESVSYYKTENGGASLRVRGAWDNYQKAIPLASGQPALRQLLDYFQERGMLDRTLWDSWTSLANMRFLELSPERLREPAFPGATVLGDSGENLPVVLREICSDPKRQEILASWIAELTPMDVTGFEFPVDPSGRVHLRLCEADGRKVSAYSASDGTLRFLAMLTVLLGENPPGLYFFEEIDTGIHPARQWLLLELIEKQAAKRGIQVVTTTHSPDLLTFVNDSTFEHLSVVGRLEDSQDAIIRPVAGLPNARKLRKSQGLGKLLTGAWMEDMLAFTEDDNDAEGGGE